MKNRNATARPEFSIFNFQFSILILLFLLSCSGTSRNKITTIEFWALGREGEVVVSLLPQFHREHPDVRVDVQQIPWTAAHEKLLTAHVGNSFPDMAQIGNTWIPELVALRAVEPLDARVAASKSVVPGDYFPGIWETNVVGGTLYGLPWYVDTRVLFYRTDMIARPPRTWSEWVAQMEQLERRARDPHFFPLLLPTNEWAQPVLFAVQLGAPLVTEDGQARFDDPRFVKAFSFYLDLYRRGLAPKLSSGQVSNLYQQFGAGEFAMFMSGPWDVGNLRERLGPELQSKWSTAPLPSPDGTPYPGKSLSGGSSLVISSNSDKQDASWKLIEFLSRPEIQMRFFELSGDLPARRAAWTIPKLANDPQIAAFRTQLDHTAALPRLPEWENIATSVFETGQLATLGKYKDAQQAALALDRKVDGMLEKRRWVLSR
ncbi:MAG TPA: sugar ABC transporter substrate-binding protein [Thermoanaerobaculia bacterium]|nr:sugar ABC transporter substrate-binding protein [Thermoanaerobaculia bacterium]